MAMGDLVLLEGEVSPVMKALQAGAVDQTALHNHFWATNDAVTLAKGLRAALDQTNTKKL